MITDDGRWQAWEAWADRSIGGDAERRANAVQAAKHALDDGLGPQAAVVAARVSAGMVVPTTESRMLWDEIQTITRVAAELASLQPSGDLTEKALVQLRATYQLRLERLQNLYQSLGRSPASVTGSPPAARTAIQQRLTLREFFADNSILLISVAGAFLLIVATLLFEVYGTAAFGGAGRFAAVLALNLIFGLAGYLCLARPNLRLVGQTYTAIFALMVPLTVAAAWVFLLLGSHGITSQLATGLGGIACSVLYGFLAVRLNSKAYAVLSLAALAVGWIGLAAARQPGVWMAPALVPLLFAYIAVAFPPLRSPGKVALFSRYAEPFVHGAAILAIGWSLVSAVSEWSDQSLSGSRPSFQLPVTLGLVTASYAFYVWRSRRAWMGWTIWAGVSFTLLAINDPLGFPLRAYVIELVGLSWAYALGARWVAIPPVRGFVLAGAAAQAAIPCLLASSPDWVQAVALLGATGVGIYLAVETRQPLWLLLAEGVFAVDWFWLAKVSLPPPPRPTADTLVLTYSPLPAVYGVLGLGLTLSRRREWARPLQVAAAGLAAAVVFAAVGFSDYTLAGRALIVFAALAYVISALERWWSGILVALLAAAGAIVFLMVGASAASAWYPIAMTGIAVLVYGTQALWRRPDFARAHRYAGLAIAALTAASSFAVPSFWNHSSLGSLAALVSLLALAGLTLIDGRRQSRPLFDYAAAGIASLGCVWIARYLVIDNPQADTAFPGIVLIAAGVIAQLDSRRPASFIWCRAAIIAGALGVVGVSAVQSVTDASPAFYTILWVVEAVLMLLVGIGLRSRTLVVVGAAALALGALRALAIILESVQVYVVFGVIAILLLVGAGVLAATRDRLSTARLAIRESWQDWT